MLKGVGRMTAYSTMAAGRLNIVHRGRTVFLVALLSAAGLRGDPGSPGELRAGAAVVDITPPPGLPLWGYGGRRDLPCKEARDNLEVSVLVLEFNGGGSIPGIRRSKNRLALIGMDMGRAPGRSTMKKIREVLLEKAGIGNLFLVASHTHHGPCMELEKTGLTAAYIKTLVDRIAAASVSAVKSLRPAKMGLASRQVDLNRNRHDRRADAPVDRTLSVVRVVALDDSSIATVVNYAAHPTTLPAIMMKYSSDYPGILKDLVEKALGGVCVFLQGAAGDLSVKLDGQGTRAYATELAKQVVSLAKTVKPAAPAQPGLSIRTEELSFPKLRVDFTDRLTYLKYCVAFFKDLVDAYIEEYSEGVRPVLTVAVLNSELAVVGVSGEVFCGHALDVRKRSGFRSLLFLGYCNGYHQYFPTREAVRKGGYGADPLVSPVEIGAGESIMERALFHLRELRGKRK